MPTSRYFRMIHSIDSTDVDSLYAAHDCAHHAPVWRIGYQVFPVFTTSGAGILAGARDWIEAKGRARVSKSTAVVVADLWGA